MSDEAVAGAGVGSIGRAPEKVARLYAVLPVGTPPLLVAGLTLGAVGDGLLRAPGAPGLNVSMWVSAVAVAALLLHRRTARPLDRERVVWLAIGVVFAAGLTWRDAAPLKLFALACATLAFALASHGLDASWVRRAGVLLYPAAWGLSALHAWTAPALALLDVAFAPPLEEAGLPGRGDGASVRDSVGRRRAAAVARGLAIATPLVVVFGALFVSADAVFADLVLSVVRVDMEQIAGHALLFGIAGWLATGYLLGFLTGTKLPRLPGLWQGGGLGDLTPKRPTLGLTEIATALAALGLLFLLFVLVQFRYLFGGDALVQVTPSLTYAEYARRGFFELVCAVVLIVPVLLAAEWLLDRRSRRDGVVFRSLAAVQIGLVLAVTASAFQRLRLYHASYGLTESRVYAMVLLIWIGVVLLWLAATVLRGHRQVFAFGALASGLATVAVLFVVNPDALVARTNVARMPPNAPSRFDVAYATSLSADAVPVLLDALATLPGDVQCPLARHMLRSWPPERVSSIRTWNWSAARASRAVREREADLRSMVGPDQTCAAPASPAAK